MARRGENAQMLTAGKAQGRLDWRGVDEEVNAERGLVYIYVRPTEANLQPIYFCVDDDRSFIEQFGFAEWHSHPHEIEHAVETARLLVRGERCVVEQRDAKGKYLDLGKIYKRIRSWPIRSSPIHAKTTTHCSRTRRH